MELIKPEPLIIDGRAYYTLSSYEPVSVEIDVPSITEKDVDYALQMTIMQEGGGPERLSDDAWIRDKFEGVHNAAELRRLVRDDMQIMSEQLVEQQKYSMCMQKLAERLQQQVPEHQVTQARVDMEQAFYMTLSKQGVTEDEFLAQNGMSHNDLDAMLDKQAKEAAEEEAAVEAWATKNGVRVTDEELPSLLSIDPAKNEDFIKHLQATGELEDARRAATRIKALHMFMSECSFTYNHEPSGPNLKLV